MRFKFLVDKICYNDLALFIKVAVLPYQYNLNHDKIMIVADIRIIK